MNSKRYSTMLTISLMATFGLTGCMSWYDIAASTDTRLCARDDGSFYQCSDVMTTQLQSTEKVDRNPSLYNTDSQFTQLGEYTEQMAYEFAKTLTIKPMQLSIGIESVPEESSNPVSPLITRVLVESLISAMQHEGMPVSELGLNRNTFSHSGYQELGYLLTTNILTGPNGYIFNARVIQIGDKQVVASSSKLIPYAVSDHFM